MTDTEEPFMKKVTLYLDERIWRLFRVACLEHSTSASKVVAHFIRQYLKEADHPKESSDAARR